MDMTIRPIRISERKYISTQSWHLIRKTGCIGYLHADLSRNGSQFNSVWTVCGSKYNSDTFRRTLDEVLYMLRHNERYSGFLENIVSANDYSENYHEESSDRNDTRDYGVRIDARSYTFLLRSNSKEDNKLFCYCYLKGLLDHHIAKAVVGIRFVDPNGDRQFTVQDGDKIRIISFAGEKKECIVRYIDDTHFEIEGDDGNLLEISEFIQSIEADGSTLIPIRSSLPKKCYSVCEESNKLIVIERGEPGYRESNVNTEGVAIREAADEENRKLGVTRKQEAAMLVGCLFGWETHGADPTNLDENGKFIYPKRRTKKTSEGNIKNVEE